MEPAIAHAYAVEAVRCFVQKGWLFDWKLPTKVKLIHPDGPEYFHQTGVVFIDVFGHEWAGAEQYIRLCVLFPQQRMPMHHHKLRQETFTVLRGTVILLTEDVCGPRRTQIYPGEKMAPKIGELHGVETGLMGGAYVGVCHKDHLTDVYWKDEAGMSDKRMTTVDLVGIPHLPCAAQADFDAQGSLFFVRWESLIPDLARIEQ